MTHGVSFEIYLAECLIKFPPQSLVVKLNVRNNQSPSSLKTLFNDFTYWEEKLPSRVSKEKWQIKTKRKALQCRCRREARRKNPVVWKTIRTGLVREWEPSSATRHPATLRWTRLSTDWLPLSHQLHLRPHVSFRRHRVARSLYPKSNLNVICQKRQSVLFILW